MSWLKVRGLEHYAAVRDLFDGLDAEQDVLALAELRGWVSREVDPESLQLLEAERGPVVMQTLEQRVAQHSASIDFSQIDTAYEIVSKGKKNWGVSNLLLEAFAWGFGHENRELLSLPQVAAQRIASKRDDVSHLTIYGRSQECVGRDHGYFFGSASWPIVVWVHGGELFDALDAHHSFEQDKRTNRYIPFDEERLHRLLAYGDLPDGRNIPVSHIDDIDQTIYPLKPHAIVMELKRAKELSAGWLKEDELATNDIAIGRLGSRQLAREYAKLIRGDFGQILGVCQHNLASVDGSRTQGQQLNLLKSMATLGSAGGLIFPGSIFLGRDTGTRTYARGSSVI